jgi:glycosyltransferase involved in cell wall biosynthesis
MRHNAADYQLAIVSTYLPRKCGIATYTADLCEALGVATDDVKTVVVAIDRDQLDYDDEVLLKIDQDQIEDYSGAAEVLRTAGVSVVLIEHEYGIFGGTDGSHVLVLAKALTARGIPYLVTLHTVLSAPSAGQAATLRALCAGAARVTVFTETARKLAIRTGIAASHQLVVVPHGAPVILRSAPAMTSLRPDIASLVTRLSGRPTITTFGLLSEGKGIDLSIKALAEIVKVQPETQYVIAGATHPEIKRYQGESYRDRLRCEVERLGLTDNVHFIDAFLRLDDLSAILHASTLFITPYRSAEQTCSGALTFALAAGLPVVSSAYRYAEDMLSSGAGRVVAIDDEIALASAVTDLLTDRTALAAARRAAAAIASWLPWPTVAAREAELIREVVARAGSDCYPAPDPVTPSLVLDHLDRLTDEIGILQFATADQPDPTSGYCVDDVARLAIVAADLLALGFGPMTGEGRLALRWLGQSIRFLSAAASGRGGPGLPALHNQLSYAGIWEDWPHFGDHVGRAMWGLGVVAGTPEVPAGIRAAATTQLGRLATRGSILATDGRPEIGLRTAGYALLGLARAGHAGEPVRGLVDRLVRAFRTRTDEDPSWRWFEPELTYDNARLPQALLAGAIAVDDPDAAACALDALDWYTDHLRLDASPLRCVGNVWHRRGDDPRAWRASDGDEQPIDAGALTEAFADAWRYRASAQDAMLADHCLSWFLGRNRVGARLYAERSGACHDGLSPAGMNANQGAESTLAYHQALLAVLRAGLGSLPTHELATEETSTTTQTGRTVAGRATTKRPTVTDRSSTSRVRITEGQTDAR